MEKFQPLDKVGEKEINKIGQLEIFKKQMKLDINLFLIIQI